VDRIKISEAAKHAGVTPSTVRRWMQTGKLTGARNSMGDWEVDHESLMAHLAKQPLPANAQSAAHIAPAQPSNEGEALRLALIALDREREALERERAIADDLRADCRALQAEVRALLSGGLESCVSRWMRVPVQENAQHTPQQSIAPQQQATLEQPIEQTAQEETNLPKKEQPTFSQICCQYAAQGMTPEQIAAHIRQETGRSVNAANVRMILSRQNTSVN